MLKYLAAALLLICMAGSAQAQVPPYVYPITLGTSPVAILSADPLRKKLIFHNPNATAMVAVCPAGPARNNVTLTPAVNGAGCITILPYDRVEISGSTASGPQQNMQSAWNGIASAGSSALTILEFE